MREPDFQDALIRLGIVPIARTTAEFSDVIKSDYARWGGLIRDANVKAD